MKRAIALVTLLCMVLASIPAFAASEASQRAYTTETFKDEVIFTATSLDGNWNASGLKNYDGGATQYAVGKDSASHYAISGIKEGNYEVFAWMIPAKQDSESGTNVVIAHNGKKNLVNVKTKLADGETVPGGWTSVGVFDFAGVEGEQVSYVSPGGNVRATAVKLVPTTKELTKAEEVTEKTPVNKEPGDTSRVEATSGLSMSIDVDPQGRCIYAGPWAFSTAVQGPMTKAPSTLWVAENPDADVYVTYHPEITSVGKVRISVFVPYWAKNQTKDIKYEVYHDGGMDEFHVNPAAQTEAIWQELGTFEFNGSGTEYVKLVCTGVGEAIANTRASTVAFEVLNSANENAVWTTVFVTPQSDSESLINSAKASMAPLDKFDDMVGHWANYDVEYMADRGLVSGVADNAFDPEAQITRAEYVTILDRAMGYEITNGASFADVAGDAWFAPYVATAKANGLLVGLPTDDGFKPEQPITREEMALFTYNAIKATKKNDEWVATMPDDYAKFTDTAEVSAWAETALKYLIQTGIIKGTSDTTVSALDNATRAQGAVILKRFMQLFVWGGPPTDEEWVLTFNDEFFGDSLDWAVWDSEVGGGSHTLSSRWPENAVVKDGNLHLEIRKEQKTGFTNEWTAASVWVRDEVFRQSQGYWEARYKYNAGAGVNNAWWMMTKKHQVTDDKQNYEIDINEGHYPHKINTNLHHYESGTGKSEASVHKANYDLSADYHTYAIKWDENEIIYYFDNEEIARNKNFNSIVPVSPWFSTAVLNWAGNADDQTDGSAMIVDYCRVYQRKADVDNPALTMIGKPLENAVKPGSNYTPPASSTTNSASSGSTNIITTLTPDNSTQEGEIIIKPTAYAPEAWGDSSLKNFDGTGTTWTNKKDYSVTYTPETPLKGKYKVYYWVIPNVKDGGVGFTARVNVGGESKDTLIKTNFENAESGWILLGEYEFKGTADENVMGIAGGNTRGTGVKFVPVK
ncbi:MAG: S-layer homology domain-containing protein [Clostridia bacterium]|nr:S-layer homology domain-containing protein [Clostridia bacterium]